MELTLRVSKMGDKKLIVIPRAYHRFISVGDRAEVSIHENKRFDVKFDRFEQFASDFEK